MGRSIDLAPLRDQNPDPAIVEVTLVASPARVEILTGQLADVWAYRDGSIPGAAPRIPGPLIEAKQGDTVIVHLRNELDEGTSAHFHGIRLPESMDGAHEIVFPGTTFDYTFVAKDAGTFWYHPHFHADVQIERGLYGPMIVHEDARPASPGERILVLDDVKLTPDGALAGEWTAMDIAHGRQGNVLLVNGVPAAVEASPGAPSPGALTRPVVRAIAGSRERWHLVNAANGRFFHLTMPGHPFEVIGWDTGLLPEPYLATTLLIAPGERYDVLLPVPDSPGEKLELGSLPHDRGDGVGDATDSVLLDVEIESGLPFDAAPGHAGTIAALPITTATVTRSFTLGEDLGSKYGPLFFINGEIWPFNTPIDAHLGDLEVWDVKNAMSEDHPFHLHGMFFQVLSRAGVAEPRLGWKDTVIVGRDSSVRFAVRYETPGMWMYHCQIPEHAERGMMGEVRVAAP
ncbi:MAG: multicopper oxidase family protein [Byssovorax sp.]